MIRSTFEVGASDYLLGTVFIKQYCSAGVFMQFRSGSAGISAIICLALLTACNKAPMRTDAQVAAEVQNKIGGDSRVTSRDIGVQAENGVVTLNGNVASDGERASAAKDAAVVDGVKTVVNNLIVQQGEEASAGLRRPVEASKSTKNAPDKTGKSIPLAKAGVD